jgi:hypothetical protein
MDPLTAQICRGYRCRRGSPPNRSVGWLGRSAHICLQSQHSVVQTLTHKFQSEQGKIHTLRRTRQNLHVARTRTTHALSLSILAHPRKSPTHTCYSGSAQWYVSIQCVQVTVYHKFMSAPVEGSKRVPAPHSRHSPLVSAQVWHVLSCPSALQQNPPPHTSPAQSKSAVHSSPEGRMGANSS